jgi:hypothetical protein
MIIFKPKIVAISSPLSDPEDFLNNISNEKVSLQLAERYGNQFCTLHPKFENELLVHLSSTKPIMTVLSFCCQDFKEKLDLLADNTNPFALDSDSNES